MSVGWEAIRCRHNDAPYHGKGWHLQALHTGHLRRDDNGNPLLFATKNDANRYRRDLETGLTSIDKDESDVYRQHHK